MNPCFALAIGIEAGGLRESLGCRKNAGVTQALVRALGSGTIEVPRVLAGPERHEHCLADRMCSLESKLVNKVVAVLCLSGILISSAEASEECRNEIQMFEHDVRMARENKERVFWRLAAANYQRRVMRYCSAEERRAAIGGLSLTVDEQELMAFALK